MRGRKERKVVFTSVDVSQMMEVSAGCLTLDKGSDLFPGHDGRFDRSDGRDRGQSGGGGDGSADNT